MSVGISVIISVYNGEIFVSEEISFILLCFVISGFNINRHQEI
jgi:hypothetical protein